MFKSAASTTESIVKPLMSIMEKLAKHITAQQAVVAANTERITAINVEQEVTTIDIAKAQTILQNVKAIVGEA